MIKLELCVHAVISSSKKSIRLLMADPPTNQNAEFEMWVDFLKKDMDFLRSYFFCQN